MDEDYVQSKNNQMFLLKVKIIGDQEIKQSFKAWLFKTVDGYNSLGNKQWEKHQPKYPLRILSPCFAHMKPFYSFKLKENEAEQKRECNYRMADQES